MALRNADRVKETSTTTGTGTYSLAGAVTGFQTFVAGVGTGNYCNYVATDGTDWEVGIGLVTDATPDTLARTVVLQSSNADAAVSWAAGTRTLFVAPLAAGQSGNDWRITPVCRALTNAYTNSNVAAKVTGLDIPNLQPGTYIAKYYLQMQNGTAANGCDLSVNFTGTATGKVHYQYLDAGTSAVTPSMDNTGAAGQIGGAAGATNFSAAATQMTVTTFATAATNTYMQVTAIIVVTAAGNLELWAKSQSSSTAQISVGSSVVVQQTN